MRRTFCLCRMFGYLCGCCLFCFFCFMGCGLSRPLELSTSFRGVDCEGGVLERERERNFLGFLYS